jgi:hypothetical protein
MKLPLSTRLWLAWFILHGTIRSTSWDGRSNSISLEVENTKTMTERLRP